MESLKSGVKQSIVLLIHPFMMIATLSPTWHCGSLLSETLSTQFSQGALFCWYLLELPRREDTLSMLNPVVSSSSVRAIWIKWKYMSRSVWSTAQAITWHLKPGFSLVEFGLWSYQPAMWTGSICCQRLRCLSLIFTAVFHYLHMGRSNEWPQWWGLCRTGSSARQIQLLSQCRLPMARVLVYANLQCSNF